MGKISPVSAKYIVNSMIEIEGIVDKPDVVGAIFGQTEGLLGSDLELRELQRSGRIGRIEVNVETKGGKTRGNIIIPSSLDKAETAIVGAALEIIQRIGPCNAKLQVQNIEDVRVSKRAFVIERAKELLKGLMDSSMPDSQEIADEVAYSVRVMEIQEYGKDRLPAGPGLNEADEVIVVEGRADVVNLLKNGFKNCIAINGTSVPETLIELSKKKVLTAFVDGDRGGDLIIKELIAVAEVDFVTKAPDGKEVEEITKKEIHKALRARISSEQAQHEMGKNGGGQPQRPPQQDNRYVNRDRGDRRPQFPQRPPQQQQSRPPQFPQRPPQHPQGRQPSVSPEQKQKFKGMLENLVGTRGAQVLDENMNVLGKVPVSELPTAIKSLGEGVFAVVFDGNIERDLVMVAEAGNLKCLVGMDSKVRSNETRVEILTVKDL